MTTSRAFSHVAVLLALGLAPASALAQEIVAPTNRASVEPGPMRVVVVAPAGATKTIVNLDGDELGRFSGPGRHELTGRIEQLGLHGLRAQSFDAAGSPLGDACIMVHARTLLPPAARGRVRMHVGRSGIVHMNERTATMLANARGWLEANGGCPAGRASSRYVTQGSYDRSVDAGTHVGGGALDLSVAGLSAPQRDQLVRALREAGFAAWLRRQPTFTIDHIHAVAVGDPDLAPAARNQVTAYLDGRDGLAGDRRDPHGGPIVKSWMQRQRTTRGLAGLGQ